MEKEGTVTVVAMSEQDLEQVLEIEDSSFPLPWKRQHFLDELSSPHSFPLVALEAGSRVAGYICPMVVLDEGHILDVAVHPACRCRGIGRLLIEAALRECRARHAAFVSLEVRASNASAIGLYGSLGFRESGRRKRYYENGEDALLMEYLY